VTILYITLGVLALLAIIGNPTGAADCVILLVLVGIAAAAGPVGWLLLAILLSGKAAA
jgi:hypothetical protein